MSNTSTNRLVYTSWSLSTIVALLAVIAWGNSLQWHASSISAYSFFPLLGLVGFSVMWSHYVAGFLQETLGSDEQALKTYFRYTSYVVLLAILLHPGILIYQRFRDGYGLPPGSYDNYFGPSLKWVVMLGSVSLLAFLAFELHRFFGQKSWWKYVLSAGDLAMVAIFYHGLRLGDQLQSGWLRYVWIFYGLVLIAILLRKYALLLPKTLKARLHFG